MTTPIDTADLLRRLKEKILAEWEKQVRESIPASRSQEKLALRNSLPEVIDAMIVMLADPNPHEALSSEEERLARGHGRQRAESASYSLEQVIDEYHVLRRVLFAALEEGDRELSRADRDLIWDVLFIAIKRAAAEFKAIRDQQSDRLREKLDAANVQLEGALGEKSAEAVLKGQLLKTIFERVEDYAIFSLDASGHIASWTSGCEKIKEFSAADVMGNHYSMLYPTEGIIRRDPEKHLEIAAREGRFRGEGLRRRKSGELFLADVFIAPMFEGDELVGFFKIVTDLTQRNRMVQERDLSRMRAEFLEVESELRDRFLFTLSHDLRNPLMAARMSCAMMAKHPCGAEQHAVLADRALRSIDRVDRMVSDFLDAGKITAGKPVTLHVEELDAVKELQAVCEELGAVHGDRFVLEGPSSLLCFWDREGMKRVAENLMTNAIKYGDPAGKVTIGVQEVHDRVLLTVHNLGSHIDEKDQDSLFDLFRRTRAAAGSGKQGWGLGLTLVRGITEAHGGIVKVRSLPGEGTTFILDLPQDATSASER